MKRAPALERCVKDIRADDFRVRILGIVVDKDDANNSILIDDGTGRAVAVFPDPDFMKGLAEGKPVRVIGKNRNGNPIEIEVEVVQDMSKLDMDLYEKVRNISEKIVGYD
ncbi:MAG: hypothetical protein ACE5G7_02565 [Candidatus Hydrothermarchaeaceae archaeon]